MTELEQAVDDIVNNDLKAPPKPFPTPKVISPFKAQSVAEQLLNVAESIKLIHAEIDAMQADFEKRMAETTAEIDKRLLAIRKSMGSRA